LSSALSALSVPLTLLERERSPCGEKSALRLTDSALSGSTIPKLLLPEKLFERERIACGERSAQEFLRLLERTFSDEALLSLLSGVPG
jgi:hypothetical protein|tara:strand:+ start:227 stop:490 length:264 start_codon:yes stop_codon:yes gene_type:complete